ncbi:TPA: hypothetical protein N2D99_002222 [Clostridium botulinum]|nr:hypothetical protein [Clostridium botulinum]
MKNFDNAKTEELIRGLQEEGVNISVETIDEYLQKQGVLVKIHVGRIRNYVEVSPKLFGVNNEESEQLKEFFKEYMKNGSLTFIPNSYEKTLKAIESKVRMKKNRLALGYDGEYMTIDTYREYAQYVKECREEYLIQRNLIVSNWANLMSKFREVVRSSLEQMNAISKETIYNEIISRIPSKEEYSRSFYMDISLKAFPVMSNINLFDEDIAEEVKKSIKQESVRSVYEILGNTLGDAFENINNILLSYDNTGKIANKTLGAVKECGRRIGKKNLFKNAVIDSIILDINEMTNIIDHGDIAEKCEIILSKIYGYAEEIEVLDYINTRKSLLTEEEMLLIYGTFENKDDQHMSMISL